MADTETTQTPGAATDDYHTRRLRRRTAGVAAAFFLPHLRPGMLVLDVGCGPGTITVGLAQAVAPGAVIGVDRDENRLEMARAAAKDQGIENVSFQTGGIHQLPFADQSFDAALVHAVMEHIAEPVAALREVRRVLKPGGVVGARSAEHPAGLSWPNPEPMLRIRELDARLKAEKGEDRQIGRKLRSMLHAAGFARVTGSATVETAGTLEETRRMGSELSRIIGTGPWMHECLERGWIDQAELDGLVEAVTRWSELPDAFYAVTWCEAVGWVE